MGTETVLGVGETYSYDGNDVEITSIGQSTVAVKVGSTTKFLSENEDYDYGEITVEVENILYTDDPDSRQVQLSIGTDVTKTVNSGDPLELFGEPDDESDAKWLWYIEASSSDTKIGAQLNEELERVEDNVVPVGESYNFPENFAYVKFDSLTADADMKISANFEDNVKVTRNESGATIEVTHPYALYLKSDREEEGFQVDVNGVLEDTDEVWIIQDTTIFGAFRNSDNKIQYFDYGADTAFPDAEDELFIKYDTTSIEVTLNYTANDGYITLNDFGGSGDDLIINADIDAQTLGSTAEDAEAAELNLSSSEPSGVGAKDESWRTPYGNIIETPENNGDKDEFVLYVAPEQIKAKVIVGGPSATITTTGDAYTVNSIAGVPLVKLDTEVADKTAQPLILVGGPAVNKLTAEALGLSYPSYGAASTIPTNKAMLKLVEDAFGGSNVALIVAGWEAENTREAAAILKNYDQHDLSGDSVSISGTTITPITEEPEVEETTTEETATE